MAIGPHARRDQSTRRWIVCFLTVAFALRALIPVGFMPDLAAARHGNFRVIICTVHGMVVAEVDDTGKIVPKKSDANAAQQCVFSALATLSLPAFDGGLELSGQRIIAAVIPPLADLPPARAGPQLGSRGPPAIS